MGMRLERLRNVLESGVLDVFPSYSPVYNECPSLPCNSPPPSTPPPTPSRTHPYPHPAERRRGKEKKMKLGSP